MCGFFCLFYFLSATQNSWSSPLFLPSPIFFFFFLKAPASSAVPQCCPITPIIDCRTPVLAQSLCLPLFLVNSWRKIWMLLIFYNFLFKYCREPFSITLVISCSHLPQWIFWLWPHLNPISCVLITAPQPPLHWNCEVWWMTTSLTFCFSFCEYI